MPKSKPIKANDERYWWVQPGISKPAHTPRISGPFRTRDNAERCAVAMMGTGNCESVRIFDTDDPNADHQKP